jgi:hypothetical protein
MPLVDRVVFLSNETARPNLVAELIAERFLRFVIGGQPTKVVEPLVQESLHRGMDTLLLTDLAAGEPSPDGEVLRSVLRLRKVGADLSNCGQVTTILASHRIKTALVLVNVDAERPSSLPSEETARDLRLLLSQSRR